MSTPAQERLVPVESEADIPERYRETPIGDLLRFQNLGAVPVPPTAPRLLIGMCMDFRKSLAIPREFAYVVRTAGGNLRPNEFQISYAVAVGGVRAIALLVHDGCGMSGLAERRQVFIDGLVEAAGWSRTDAEEHFDHLAPLHEIGDEIDFVAAEAARLRRRYPRLPVAPMLYRLSDHRLYLVREDPAAK